MMLSLGFRLEQNLVQRQSLIQELGLESLFLQSSLVRSETLLRELKYQRPLRLIRHFADETEYRSVLDFLVAIFVPSLKGAVEAFYDGHGEQLIVMTPHDMIMRIDRKLARCIVELEQLDREMRGWSSKQRRDMAEGWSDLVARPMFPAVEGPD